MLIAKSSQPGVIEVICCLFPTRHAEKDCDKMVFL